MKKYTKAVNFPKTERGKASFDAIIKAAEKQFSAKGYHNASIKDITEEAQLGLGTFYIYFDSKLACYKYLISTYSHYIRMRIAMRIKDVDSRREAERLGVLEFMEIVKEKQHIYHIIWQSLYIDKNIFIEYYTSFAERYIDEIEKYKKKGEFREANSEVMAYMLIGISNFIGLRYAVFSDHDSDYLEQISYEVLDLLDQGFFTN